MNINIALGILLILIILYFLILVISLRKRNQLVDKAQRWNNFRDMLLIQAQRDQVNAHRKTLSIQKKYKELGAPYVEDRDQALGILRRISDIARNVLDDPKNRPPISTVPTPFSWKTLLISPLLFEYRERQNWWKTTEKLGSRLSRNPSGFKAIEKLEIRLADKGINTKSEFDTLKSKTGELIKAYQEEARSSMQFREQIEELAQLDQNIDQTIGTNLAGRELTPKQVAAAVSTLGFYQRALTQLNLTLQSSKDIRRKSRTQLEKNQALIDTIEELIKTEEEINRPIRTFLETLNAEIQLKEEQEQQRKTGTYLQQPAQEQYQRLKELEKNLRVLIQERINLEERLTRGEREITQTEAWLKTIELPFVIDQTDIILEEVQKQQSMLYQLIHSSEDRALLSSQIFIDPQKLASNRVNFDQRVKTYQTLFQELEGQISPSLERVRTNIHNLQPLHANYHKGLDLNNLSAQAQSLEEKWIATKKRPQIQESRIDQLIEDLRQVEKSLLLINNTNKIAEDGFNTNIADRADAQKLIEGPAFVEYHQVMQVISREYQVSLYSQAEEYAHEAERLNYSLDLINTDFTAAIRDATSLLAKMQTLWASYKRLYTDERKAYQELADKMTGLQTRFEKYQTHELSAFRNRVAEPLNTIYTWLGSTPAQSVQELIYHIDLGYEHYDEIMEIVKGLSEDYQTYTRAKDDALKAISEAKRAIEQAENELKRIPWGKQSVDHNSRASKERNTVLAHSYRYQDSAEAAYKAITDPEFETYNTIEMAVRDLRERVQQQANHAKTDAESIQRELREQSNEINEKCEDLEATLASGEGYSMRLEDSGFRSQWAQIYRKYHRFESELEKQGSYREAFSYLEQALIESRYQIERMRDFEESG